MEVRCLLEDATFADPLDIYQLSRLGESVSSTNEPGMQSSLTVTTVWGSMM